MQEYPKAVYRGGKPSDKFEDVRNVDNAEAELAAAAEGFTPLDAEADKPKAKGGK